MLAFAFTGCATYNHSSAWEYKAATCTGDSQDVEKQINDMTQQGWHFVSIAAGAGDATHWPTAILVFKRAK
jgi:hypothetical protein